MNRYKRYLFVLLGITFATCLIGLRNVHAGLISSQPPILWPDLVIEQPKHVVKIKPKPTDVRNYIPERAVLQIPTLKAVQLEQWPATPYPWLLGSQIEHESCISLTHSRCWSSTSELKTKREYGFGLGQLTIAYNADGTERFNNFSGMKKQIPQLRDWDWEDRFSAPKQMMVFVHMMKIEYNRAKWTSDPATKYAFGLVAYNGGYGGVLKDRTLCGAAQGCDPNLWYGHVELYSTKSRVANKGYGKSSYEINRHYPIDIMKIRADKYRAVWGR